MVRIQRGGPGKTERGAREERMSMKETGRDGRNLFVQMTDPLGKLSCVGDGCREEHVVHVVGEKNDGLLPDHTPLWRETITESKLHSTGLAWEWDIPPGLHVCTQ